jgi:hypothetical protein
VLGALLFYTADMSLAIDHFLVHIPHSSLLTSGVYWVGQAGIATAARAGVESDGGSPVLLRSLNAVLMFFLHLERRFEPLFRGAFDALLRKPLAACLQFLINLRRSRDVPPLAGEKHLDGEEGALQDIIDTMAQQMRNHFKPGSYERGGNTKTHGIVRAVFSVREDLPPNLRRGLFATSRSYPAWVRFSGPGPDVIPDIDDVGFVSMSVKVMGVEGPKLLDDEKATQDFLTVCTPTFVTPNVVENAVLQHWSLQEMPIFYFLDPRRPHLLDMLMQGLWNKTQHNPLGQDYYSCVPYLLGEGQAMQYSFHPLTKVPWHIPRLPFRPPDNYLRDNMVRTLDHLDVDFDLRVQVQTDSFRMPIENAAVLWPERLSPRVPVARVHIPRQKFDSPAQFDFGKRLSWNPWHCLPEHRPIGNQSRARLRMYSELSRFRQRMNGTPHVEPTGSETFS